MPSTKIMWGGWVDIKPDKLRVMWGGWTAPLSVKSRHNNAWVDWGYTTAPRAPINFGVASWDYSTVNLTFAGPSGGNPPSYYRVEKLNEAGTLLEAKNDTTGSVSFGVSQMTRYIFRVQSVAANGLTSPWSDQIRAFIGQPKITGYQNVQRWRDWSSAEASNWQYNGTIVGPTAPALNTATYGFAVGVIVHHMRVYLWSPAGFPTTEVPFGLCYWMWNGTAGAPTYHWNVGLPWGPGWVEHPVRGNWSNGQPWGLWFTGSAYDDKYGTPPFWTYITIAGTEYYANSELYTIQGSISNDYW